MGGGVLYGTDSFRDACIPFKILTQSMKLPTYKTMEPVHVRLPTSDVVIEWPF